MRGVFWAYMLNTRARPCQSDGPWDKLRNKQLDASRTSLDHQQHVTQSSLLTMDPPPSSLTGACFDLWRSCRMVIDISSTLPPPVRRAACHRPSESGLGPWKRCAKHRPAINARNPYKIQFQYCLSYKPDLPKDDPPFAKTTTA